jgi:L-malate glycosyltransferase
MIIGSPIERSSQDNKVKIMFIIDFIVGILGGTENQLVKLLSHLSRDRYEVSLLCLHDTTWLRESAASLKCPVQAFKYNMFNHKDLNNIGESIRIYKFIKRSRPDIVVTFFPTSYIAGVILARLAGVRSIISTRRDFGLWLDKRSLPLLRFANRFVTKVVTNARVIKDLVIKEEGYDPARIEVVYNGIDIKEFEKHDAVGRKWMEELSIPSESQVVGIVAGLRPMKRYDTFLKAARKISGERKDVHFAIVGDGPLRRSLEEDAASLDLTKKVHFIGWQKDVRTALSCFDIGVNCSANEGLSNAIMEYMAYGIPCIVSRAGGNVELIEHDVNGYVFELGNAEQLADMILELLMNKEKRQDFIDRSKERIRTRFGIPSMISEYERCFAEVLDKGNEKSGLMINA